MMGNFQRESGILFHISSLPGEYGMGEIGPHAYEFVDALSRMGQTLWQILPTGDTGDGHSPYSTTSAFANSPMLISFDLLVEDGLLPRSELDGAPDFSKEKIDFNLVVPFRRGIINTVCNLFFNCASMELKDQFNLFCQTNDYWLKTYTLFKSIKEFNKKKCWVEWRNIFSFNHEEIDDLQSYFKTEIQFLKIQQFLFFNQWQRLKKYANDKGVRIIGDIPIYISHDSADVWANPELFKLDEQGKMKYQSGCPPDFFLEEGQVWGHPIYDWKVHEKTGYSWWTDRLKYLFNFVDIIRIDHFNGFAKYWEIPMNSSNGESAKWVEGPGETFLNAVRTKLGDKPIIAEDLGDATADAKIIREKFDIPGMKILQMSFGDGEQVINQIPDLNKEDIVVYTGTHDNDTTLGWFKTNSKNSNTQTGEEITAERKRALDFLGTDGSEINWDFIGLALNSKANTVIIPLQDVLGLGSEGRMNIPGTIEGNWAWRFEKDQLTDNKIERMKQMTKASRRGK